jgi:hypothetical protein
MTIGKPLFWSLWKMVYYKYSIKYTYTFYSKRIYGSKKKENELAYFNVLHQPLRDLNNTIYGIISIGTEITEVKHENKLKQRKRFSNILSQSLIIPF